MKLKFHSKQYTACVQTLSSNIFCAKWSSSVGTNTFQRTAVLSHCSTGSVLFVFLAQLVSIHPSIHPFKCNCPTSLFIPFPFSINSSICLSFQHEDSLSSQTRPCAMLGKSHCNLLQEK